MLRRALLGLVLTLGAVATVVQGARSASRRYVFPTAEVPGAQAPADFEPHTLIASDGVAVHALGLDASPGARTIVHFHNNRETATSGVAAARALHARGFGVLLVEYRGYGASRDSSPFEEGLYRDAECALDMLARRGYSSADIDAYFFGNWLRFFGSALPA